MFDINSLVKLEFKRRIGRPKKPKSEGATPELRQKRCRITSIANDSYHSAVLSWLHIAHNSGTINEELFELGEAYMRFRIRVLRNQEVRSLKLNCHGFDKSLSKTICPKMVYLDAKAEAIWQNLIHIVSPSILGYLDELLLGNVDYDLSETRTVSNKKPLKKALLTLLKYKNLF